MATHSETTSSLSHIAAAIGIPTLTVVDDGTEPEIETADGGPYCATCLGARWLKPAGFDPKRRYGIGEGLCRCPDCQDTQRATRLNRLARIAGLSDEQRRQTFASLAYVQAQASAVKAVSEWADRPTGWLVLYGVPGSGKTHLSLAVANRLISTERTVIWRYVPELARQLRQQVAAQEPDAITPTLMDAPILILDDLAAVRWSEWLTETLELVFDYRYRNRLPVLVTLIGNVEKMRQPNYDVAEDVKQALSVSVGRRMQDQSICRTVLNAAPQWTGKERAN